MLHVLINQLLAPFVLTVGKFAYFFIDYFFWLFEN